MIKIEDFEVMGMRKAIKGMRNAMNSWAKSDSGFFECGCPDVGTIYCGEHDSQCLIRDCKTCPMRGYDMGEKDIELAQRLIKAGSSDRKFMRMIHVQADVTAPLYWWKEYDTYKVGTTANSCSTMHTIHKRELTIDDFSYEQLLSWDYDECPTFNYKFDNDEDSEYMCTAQSVLEHTIYALNHYRDKYIKTKDKTFWWQIIQLLPSSFNQMRTIDLDYETLFSIYHQRKNHKLDDWHQFCEWIETLPYMKEFLGLEYNNETGN